MQKQEFRVYKEASSSFTDLEMDLCLPALGISFPLAPLFLFDAMSPLPDEGAIYK